MERSSAPEPSSVSFPSWLKEVTDFICDINGKSRTAFVVRGLKTQILTTMRIGHLKKLLLGNKSGAKEAVKITVCTELIARIADHCEECGYSPDNFFEVAAIRYLALKDSPESLWDDLYERMHKNEKELFKGVS